MFKIRTSKYRHVFCDQPKPEVSELAATATDAWEAMRMMGGGGFQQRNDDDDRPVPTRRVGHDDR
jgi:hypothetical protein